MEGYPVKEQRIWSCEASGNNRFYKVEQLHRDASSFELAIYNTSNFDQSKYGETVEIVVDDIQARELTGRGKNTNWKYS